MAWQLTENLETFLAAAGGFLRARAAQNTVILTAAELLRAKGPAAYGDATPLFGWLAEPGGTAAAAFLHTPPFPAVLTGMTAEAAAGLAADLAAQGYQPPGVNAMPDPAAAFAAAWQDHTGQPAHTGMRMRLYALGTLLPPDPPPPGTARTADATDRDLMLAWLDAFQDEAQPGGPNESERVVNDRIGFGGLVFWEHEGRPVSLAGRNRAAAGQARIGPVYTPPEPARPRFRRRGDGRGDPGGTRRRRRGRRAVHRPGQPHKQHPVPAPRLSPDQRLDRDPLRHPRTMMIMGMWPTGRQP